MAPRGNAKTSPFRRERIDLVRVEVDLERREELPGIGNLALPVGELSEPLEPGVVGVRPEAALLVLPVRRDAALGDQVHLSGPDLDLEGLAGLADHRRMERLVEVGLGHRDVVLDPPRHGPPELVDHAEGGVAIPGLGHDHPEGQDVVKLRDLDAVALHLEPDGVVALHPAGDLGRDARVREARLDAAADVADHGLGDLHPPGDFPRQLLVRLRLEVQERQVLELPFHAPHAQPVRDGRVDVERFAGDLPPLGFGEEAQGAHVVEAVRELDQDHPQVRDHRQEHLAEGLRLLLLARDVGELADLRQAVDEIGDLVAELLGDRLFGRQGVFEDVVEEPDDDRDVVGLQVGQDRGHVERMNQVRLARPAHLALVLEARKDVRPSEELLVRVRVVRLDLFEDFLEVDHPLRVHRG